MKTLRTILFAALLLLNRSTLTLAADVVQTLLAQTFEDKNPDAKNHQWRAERGCRTVLKNDLLHLEALNSQPYLSKHTEYIGGEFRLLLDIQTGTESQMSLYWMSKGSPRRDETNKITLPLYEDGDWHTYEFVFTVPDILTGLTLRFSANDGSWDVRSVKLVRKSPPPLSVRRAVPFLYKKEGASIEDIGQEMIKFTVANNVLVPMKYRIGNQPEELTLLRGETVNLAAPIKTEGNLAAVVLSLHPNEFPEIVHPLFLYRPEGKTDWIKKNVGDKILEVASDARMARLRQQDGELFGVIAPLVHRNGIIPKFKLAEDSTDNVLHFESDDVDLRIDVVSPLIHFEMTDKTESKDVLLEGPAVRLFGKLHSGLLPGVEFLRQGDTSSSEIDLEKPFNDRARPNPLWITMPFAVLETEKGGAVLYWDDLKLQPTFSSPNQFDQADDHRMSLIGSPVKASLELLMPTQPKESAATFRVLRSYVAQKGFPDLPVAQRTAEEQRQLSMQALIGALQSEMGGQWGYAIEPQWDRKPFADMISTLFRLTEAGGSRMQFPTILVPGGADISNDTVFFLSGRIPDWQKNRESAIRQLLAAVNPDGSFLFRTRFPEVENAGSSFGYTALHALEIMEYVRVTDNKELFVTVMKALEFLKQCDVPCGGFYRDTPFHTPDLQAAATLVWLYVWVYEYSGNTDYLERAKHFAYAGLPFVYQVNQAANALYGTTARFGGVNRHLPMDFGVLSTRSGIQYAYALCLLAKYDDQTDWKKPALGILQAVESLQYTVGLESGCIPERFDLTTQERQGWKVNPCALVSLRLAVEGKTDSLFVLVDGKDRYVAPYPLRKAAKGIEAFDVPAGQKFHILHNANRYGTGEGTGLINVD